MEKVLELKKNFEELNTTFANNDKFKLTDIQFSYFVGSSDNVPWGGINCQGYLEINLGDENIDEINKAWHTLLKRHPMLRASMHSSYGIVNPITKKNKDIDIVDLTDLLDDVIDKKIYKIREELSNVDYSLLNKPYKALILKTRECVYFNISVNLLFIDFSSVQIVITELSKLLNGELLEDIELDFVKYLEISKQKLNQDDYERSKHYWINRLKDLPTFPILPMTGRVMPEKELSKRFERKLDYLSLDELDQLKKLSSKNGLTLSSVALAAYAYVLNLWSENSKFMINIPIQRRLPVHKDVEKITGEFTSINLLEVDFSNCKTFYESTKNIFYQLLEDLEHSDYSCVNVIRELAKINGNDKAIAPYVFTGVLKNNSKYMNVEYGRTKTPQVWLDCQVVEDTECLDDKKAMIISWDIREGIFNSALIEEMFSFYINFLKSLSKDETLWHFKNTNQIPSVKEYYLNKYDCEDRGYIQDDFTNYAKNNQRDIAIIYDEQQITYGELYKDALKVSSYIKMNFDLNKDDYIAIKIDKNYKQITAIMGILISGFPYLPLDINQPKLREDKIINQANVKVILDEEMIDDAILNCKELDIKNLEITSSDIAYTIFTSGSTGIPKGVVMTHNAVKNTLNTINKMTELNKDDKVLSISEASFDLSVFNIFSTLGVGATLVIPNCDKKSDPSYWAELIKNNEITIWNSVPAQAEMLEHYCQNSKVFPTMKYVLLSGDVIKVQIPKKLNAIFPNSKLYSLGGATEGGIWSIYHKINQKADETHSIVYGKALEGQMVSVIDKNRNESKLFAVGEIIIAGDSLAKEYLNNKTATENSFIYSEELGGRYYLTGDLGRYINDSEIEFLGRIDNQLKINGYRIELSEIETNLMDHPNIKDCCVVNHKNGANNKLTAFIVEDKDKTNTDYNLIKDINKSSISYDNNELKEVDIDKFNTYLEEAILQSVYSEFKNKGVFCEEVENIEYISTKIGVKKENKYILIKVLQHLERLNYIRIFKGQIIDLNKEVDNNFWEVLKGDEFQKIAPTTVTEYIKKHSDNICALLSGDTNPLVYLFPKGDTNIAECLYEKTMISKYLNNIISKVVFNYCNLNRDVNILEVGGGIGATTKVIIEEFERNLIKDYQYVFTDVSKFFLNNIQSKHPNLKTGIYDLDKNEGFEKNEKYNVIIAAGVLNNVIDIELTLGNLYDKLHDDGILIISEPINEHIEIDISQIFMMPHRTDSRGNSKNCFFTEQEWKDIFDKRKLYVVSSYPEKDSIYSKFNQKVFIVKKKKENNSVDYKDFLEKSIPSYMIPKEYRVIEKMPLTSNCKVDKKTLINSLNENEYHNRTKTDTIIKNSIVEDIVKIYKDIGEISKLLEYEKLSDRGFDSLMLSQATGKILDLLGSEYDIKFEELLKISLMDATIMSILNYINNKKKDSEKGEILTDLTLSLLKIYRDIGGISDLKEDEKLSNRGFDSLMLSQATGKIVDMFGDEYDIKFEELLKISLMDATIISILDYIKSQKKSNYDLLINEEKITNDNINYGSNGNIYFIKPIRENDFNIVNQIAEKNNNIHLLDFSQYEDRLLKSDNLVLIAFKQTCTEALMIAQQKLINGHPLESLILIDPEIETSAKVYFGSSIIITSQQKQYIDAQRFIIGDMNIKRYKHYSSEDIYESILEVLNEI